MKIDIYAKRYWLFAGQLDEPNGGFKDFETVFDKFDLNRVKKYILYNENNVRGISGRVDIFFHVVDKEKGSIVCEGTFTRELGLDIEYINLWLQ